ncbi:hypothetical protein BaRGS_00002425, partial [Batillaria attramentaria]
MQKFILEACQKKTTARLLVAAPQKTGKFVSGSLVEGQVSSQNGILSTVCRQQGIRLGRWMVNIVPSLAAVLDIRRKLGFEGIGETQLLVCCDNGMMRCMLAVCGSLELDDRDVALRIWSSYSLMPGKSTWPGSRFQRQIDSPHAVSHIFPPTPAEAEMIMTQISKSLLHPTPLQRPWSPVVCSSTTASNSEDTAQPDSKNLKGDRTRDPNTLGAFTSSCCGTLQLVLHGLPSSHDESTSDAVLKKKWFTADAISGNSKRAISVTRFRQPTLREREVGYKLGGAATRMYLIARAESGDVSFSAAWWENKGKQVYAGRLARYSLDEWMGPGLEIPDVAAEYQLAAALLFAGFFDARIGSYINNPRPPTVKRICLEKRF